MSTGEKVLRVVFERMVSECGLSPYLRVVEVGGLEREELPEAYIRDTEGRVCYVAGINRDVLWCSQRENIIVGRVYSVGEVNIIDDYIFDCALNLHMVREREREEMERRKKVLKSNWCGKEFKEYRWPEALKRRESAVPF